MGNVASVIASILDIHDKKIVETIKVITFLDVPYMSDHFDRDSIDESAKAVQLLDGTLMVFNVAEDQIKEVEYMGAGAIDGDINRFTYNNEFFPKYKTAFSVYCMVLPTHYYPKDFYMQQPHFSARINDRIRSTWWSKSNIKVALQIERNEKNFQKYFYKYVPSFRERHPRLDAACHRGEDFMAKVTSNLVESFINK